MCNHPIPRIVGNDDYNERVNTLLSLVNADLQTERQNKRRFLRRGVAQYLFIRSKYNEGILDEEFWSVFKSFYKMNQYLYIVNMDHFMALLRPGNVLPSIGDAMTDIINTDLPPERQTADLSYASKAFHTVNNNLPIYDSRVKSFFRLPGRDGNNVHERILNAVGCYERLCRIYDNRGANGLDRLLDEYARLMGVQMEPESLQWRDRRFTLNDAMRISAVKKIDFMIWTYWRL